MRAPRRLASLAAVLAAIAALASAAASATTALLRTDPAKNLARVRLHVVTTAATTDVMLAGVTLASYTSAIVDAPSGSGASQTGKTMRTSNTQPGQTADVQFDAILADVVRGATVSWNVATDRDADVTIEVLSTNDAPRLVDRFTAHVAGTSSSAPVSFTTAGSLLVPGSSATVSIAPVSPHLVLAQYYAWYTAEGWTDPQFADRPLQPYSSDDQAAIDRQAAQAASAGIDAFVVSWQGPSNGPNTQRTTMVLDAASRAGIRAGVTIESPLANPANDPNQPTDPDTMARWIVDAVDRFSHHPAYLRIGNRPVVLVYSASGLTEGVWRSVLANVRSTGRDAIVVGDFFHSRLLNVLDGEYQYINVTHSAADLLDMYTTETLRVRTFNLLPDGGPRRIWIASVCPGYDDRRLTSRPTHLVVDRAGGSVYDDEWRTAVSTGADWVMITTWNEFFENTEIEPSQLYGTTYLDATRKWTAQFKGLPGSRR